MRRFALLSMIVLLPATVQAAGNPYTATLVQPVGSARDVTAGESIWHCEGSTCVTRSEPRGASAITTCHALVSQVGAVSAYGSATHPYSAENLAACNAQ